MEFDVIVRRTEHRKHSFRVAALTFEAAWQAGLSAACDYNFHDSPVDFADEDVISISPVPEILSD